MKHLVLKTALIVQAGRCIPCHAVSPGGFFLRLSFESS